MRLHALSTVLLAATIAASVATFAEPARARPYLASCEAGRCAQIHGTVTQTRCSMLLGTVQNALVAAYREPAGVELDGSPSMQGVISSTRTDTGGRYSLDLPVGSNEVYLYAFVRFSFWPTGWTKWFGAYRMVKPHGHHTISININTTYRDCF